jgi:hypothetical protein
MNVKSEIEIHDLARLEFCMRRVGLSMKSDKNIRRFFSAITFAGFALLINERDFPQSDFIELIKEFLTNQKGNAA